ncbi:hypothetical protein A3C09_03860 [Candidatus Uhrbacteria bacterium RIFCSPHIGHO2_02_FULL_47_44]|uniref:Uncharacterized protein n=1 Tax=Candidatus Uhrbacteria bacterium RIFCSPLOWO2_02_FULL_48_18 TaxID=1802408 RepID=A0A1F7VCN0_9BACT|nr:MAG: hypothetical protein A2839_00660 [Candidatus Uhrbacteria bacterium RIFCSPHIGHO2_01_FULL_47_10]OGL71814.1 MAG: hypothetical protein A3C09_03860 [Candidatus Uhrbacteria bacterium RIFCSPHIGHO2_02_FULL_47_44]OGL80612.1 MAG: hypothetical protein A3B20_04425 [Candidatus Uhrbacteria bacterium RIFCSPLOWO2_01_FULL_47_17]OGL88205.1 MAG: hypothetical protein A3I41_00555 [Candidatus Uhrbacteria bacterium RIFCSPLOWO2_02_FULL_48_18]
MSLSLPPTTAVFELEVEFRLEPHFESTRVEQELLEEGRPAIRLDLVPQEPELLQIQNELVHAASRMVMNKKTNDYLFQTREIPNHWFSKIRPRCDSGNTLNLLSKWDWIAQLSPHNCKDFYVLNISHFGLFVKGFS